MQSDHNDAFPLHAIYFYPTESCNLKCRHCWIRPDHAPDRSAYHRQNGANVSVAVMERVVREARPLGLGHVKLTGGEPFLNPQLFDFIDMFHRNGLSFSIETNGTLLTDAAAKKLAAYPVGFISTSLDGSTPGRHDAIRGVPGSFKRVLGGIDRLTRNGIHPQVIFCLQRQNAHDLENTIRLAGERRVRSFEINPLTLIDSESPGPADPAGLAVQDLLDLEKRVETDYARRYPNMHIDLYLPPALKGIRELARGSLNKCSVFNICGILANGDVSLCGIGRRRPQLVMGNVNHTSLAAIWREGEIFRDIRRRIPFQLEGICGRCLFRYQCLGFCRADVLFGDNPVTAPYKLCEEARARGLFPRTRILAHNQREPLAAGIDA